MIMKERLQGLLMPLPDALMVAGAGGVSYGAALMYAPAGYIVAGMFGIVAGYMAARGAK